MHICFNQFTVSSRRRLLYYLGGGILLDGSAASLRIGEREREREQQRCLISPSAKREYLRSTVKGS